MSWKRPVQHRAWRGLVVVWLVLLLPGLASVGTVRAQTERTTGNWQQFVSDNSGWRPLGVYRVERSDGAYRMEPVRQSQDPDVTTSKGLFDVRFSGSDWQFKSDWGNGDVAEFRLQRVAPGKYVGWSYLRGERRNYNLWLLMEGEPVASGQIDQRPTGRSAGDAEQTPTQ
jgi:hypothetical protein